ncbi:MAG: hypothetical protein KatS3mg082_2969 [Nitrospiraceae bacterium]|nr:MAG: hypothetical protein KatS3mg082_2969 [Nitrospiraceae bacterium]
MVSAQVTVLKTLKHVTYQLLIYTWYSMVVTWHIIMQVTLDARNAVSN